MIYFNNLRLRGIDREDIPLFLRWFNDPEVIKGISMYLPMSRAGEEQWFDEMLKRPKDEQPLMVEIKEQDGWVPIGTCGFFSINWRIRSAEIGIAIGEKSYWDKGHGTNVMRLLLRHGFGTLNLNRISLQVYEDNQRAIRAYEKAGFVQEGVLRQGAYMNGQYKDVIIMSVLRVEWKG